jgi:hypothetical protein
MTPFAFTPPVVLALPALVAALGFGPAAATGGLLMLGLLVFGAKGPRPQRGVGWSTPRSRRRA